MAVCSFYHPMSSNLDVYEEGPNIEMFEEMPEKVEHRKLKYPERKWEEKKKKKKKKIGSGRIGKTILTLGSGPNGNRKVFLFFLFSK